MPSAASAASWSATTTAAPPTCPGAWPSPSGCRRPRPGTCATCSASTSRPASRTSSSCACIPTQLYETAAALLIWAFGLWLFKRRLEAGEAPGRVALVVLALLAVERFLVEFLRAKDDRFFGGFTLAQVISLAILLVRRSGSRGCAAGGSQLRDGLRRARRVAPPRLLTIAGSDSGGGAGIQADLKTFAAHGAYGMSAITALTAQNTLGVRAVHEAPPEMVAAQIDAVLEDIGVDAVKIGMLASAADRPRRGRPAAGSSRSFARPVVLDPVMVAKSGDALLRDDAVEALLAELVPLATLVTPNLPELARLTGLPVEGEAARADAARALAACGPAVLAKGGHAEGPRSRGPPRDARRGGSPLRAPAPRTPRRRTAPAARCPRRSRRGSAAGDGLPRAVSGAIEYLQGAMAAAYPVGQRARPGGSSVPPVREESA